MSDREIIVYWRPGCGFCASLLRGLERDGLAFDRANIWDGDGSAAAFVRSVAGGNETVPTVRIGQVALVNPTAKEVLSTVAAEAPELLPEDHVPPRPGPIARAVSRLLGG
ncbi:MAG: glutaredoxin domain-containing protein [Nitriliruptoraceae bacterium]